MNGYDCIPARQTEWADNRGIALIGGQGAAALRMCAEREPLSAFIPETLEAFRRGDGQELGRPGSPGKMQAVQSSSALAVNAFQHWQRCPTMAGPRLACESLQFIVLWR